MPTSVSVSWHFKNETDKIQLMYPLVYINSVCVSLSGVAVFTISRPLMHVRMCSIPQRGEKKSTPALSGFSSLLRNTYPDWNERDRERARVYIVWQVLRAFVYTTIRDNGTAHKCKWYVWEGSEWTAVLVIVIIFSQTKTLNPSIFGLFGY